METTPTNSPLATPAKPATGSSPGAKSIVGPSFPSNLLYANFVPGNIVPTRLPRPQGRPARRFRRLVASWLAALRPAFKTSWRALVAHARRAPKALVVSETAALGDRRFVAVVQFEQQRFLIGSSPSSVTLLASLPDAAAGKSLGPNAEGFTDLIPGAGQ